MRNTSKCNTMFSSTVLNERERYMTNANEYIRTLFIPEIFQVSRSEYDTSHNLKYRLLARTAYPGEMRLQIISVSAKMVNRSRSSDRRVFL